MLRCRDEYCLKGAGEQLILRELWKDMPRECERWEDYGGVFFSDVFSGLLVLASVAPS